MNINKTDEIKKFGERFYETSEIYFNGRKIESQTIYTDGEYKIYVYITSLIDNNEIVVK